MNRTTLIIVAAGFFFALLAAMAVQMIGGKSKHAEAEIAQVKTSEVLVAAKDLKIGEELSPNATAWTTWPETSVFPGAITKIEGKSPEELTKGRVKRAIAKGEPIMKSALVDASKSNFVAASLTSGMRAISVNVNAQTSVSGFVSPGDYVDVILTYDVRVPNDEKIRKAAMPIVIKTAAETILENVRVLASDQDTDQKAEAKVGKTITLEVTPAQAEVLVLAGRMGALSLVLRSLGDDTPARPATGKPAPATTDIRISGVMKEIMKGENKSGSPSQVVRVYSGTRVENVEVRPYTSLQ